ncbi:MAG TPA: hypothetical protein VFB20_17235 [Burkholderiales bacterium]|nr:hypothetical protein [Burkholderiales bacterium]
MIYVNCLSPSARRLGTGISPCISYPGGDDFKFHAVEGGSIMRRYVQWIPAVLFALAAGVAFAADKDAMKKHEEMGKKDVYPEGKPDTGK